MMPDLVSTIIRWAAGLLLVASILGGIYVKGRLDNKAQTAAVAKTQVAVNKAETVSRNKISKISEVNHAKSSAVIGSTYAALRLRGSAGGSALPAVPDPATKPDEAAAHYISVAPELAEQCAQTTQQLTDLQEWVENQSTLRND